MKALLMTDFVLEQKKDESIDNSERYWNCEEYANFLKQPLKLEMFIPCGHRYQNVLKHPNRVMFEHEKDYVTYEQTYLEAKEKLLFKNFVQYKNLDCAVLYINITLLVDEEYCEGKTIEDFLFENKEIEFEFTENKNTYL